MLYLSVIKHISLHGMEEGGRGWREEGEGEGGGAEGRGEGGREGGRGGGREGVKLISREEEGGGFFGDEWEKTYLLENNVKCIFAHAKQWLIK